MGRHQPPNARASPGDRIRPSPSWSGLTRPSPAILYTFERRSFPKVPHWPEMVGSGPAMTGGGVAERPQPPPSIRPIPPHQHSVQPPVLAMIVIEPRFMQRSPIVENQQIPLPILMRVTKRRLYDPVGQILQKILRFLRRHAHHRLGLALVKPHRLRPRLRMRPDQRMHRRRPPGLNLSLHHIRIAVLHPSGADQRILGLRAVDFLPDILRQSLIGRAGVADRRRAPLVPRPRPGW